MDITVIIPSRKRVRGLYAVLSSLRMLESGLHKISYGVCLDNDDSETRDFCIEAQKVMPLAYRCGPRQKTMGGVINDMAERMKGDVFLVINDDILCISPSWDREIANAVEKTDYGVFWWNNALPTDTRRFMDALYPIITDKWRQAAGGIFTDHYPFWYDDLCLIELWYMTTEKEPLRLDISIVDKPVMTTRMRDLKFWQSLYTKTRRERVKKGIEIAEKLGLPIPKTGGIMAEKLTEALVSMSDERLKEIELNQGESSPPDEAYLVAKSRAQVIIDNLQESI